jgi:branched-chain amino acid transport system permease protein
MRIVNLSHGAFYLLGAYVGLVVAQRTGSFLLAIAAGGLVVAAMGLGVERVLLRRLRGQELPEVLLTIGIAFVIADVCLALFGGEPQTVPAPGTLQGGMAIGSLVYPKYRLFLMAVALVVGLGLFVVQRYTKLGAIVRAGVDDRETAAAMGINIDRVFVGVFMFGAALAGISGVIGASLLTVLPGADIDILLYALVVVIVGGLGSLKGAAVASVLIGLIDAFSKAYIPELSYFTLFAPMAVILVFRPVGLFGRKA